MRPATTITILVCIVVLWVSGSVVAASTILQTAPVSATVTILPPSISEDVDRDGCIGTRDLILVARDLGADVPAVADVNVDGRVDIVDLALVVIRFGTRIFGSGSCP